MTTLTEIEKKIAELQKKAEAIRKSQAAAAAATVRDLIARHGLTAEDVGLFGKSAKKGALKAVALKGKAGTAKPAGTPKYRDPKTGNTWTGHGRAPGWIAEAKNRDKFLVAAAGPVAASEPPPAPAPVKAAATTKKSKPVVKAVPAAAPAKKTPVVDAPKPKPAVKSAKPVAVKKSGAGKTAAKKAAPQTSAPVDAVAAPAAPASGV